MKAKAPFFSLNRLQIANLLPGIEKMNEFNLKTYEEAGLKIDQDRLLTYSQLSCPLECLYCFVDDMNFNQQRDVAYLSSDQLEMIKKLPPEIKLLMLGCDTEFFQNRSESIQILQELVSLGKDLSVVTKLILPPEQVEQLGVINQQLQANNNSLSVSISLTSTDSAKLWEPRVPNPPARIKNLENLYNAGVSTFVALRPLLPTISAGELSEIIDLTHNFCYGYYSGPLYLKDLNHPLIGEEILRSLSIEKLQPHWMPEGNVFYKLEKIGQMDMLKDLVTSYNMNLYEGAADAINHLKSKNEKH